MSGLSPQKQRAAWLVALDELTRTEIAAAVGISERQLYAWLREDEFRAEVTTHCQRLMRELIAPAIRRLKQTIKNAKPADANKACELALKAAGWVDAQKGGPSNAGSAAPAPAPDDGRRSLDPAELDRRITEALERSRSGRG